MNEVFLQFLWKHQLLKKDAWITSRDENIELIDPGQWNHDSGPDFFNARIRLNKMEWAGNVEIH